MCATALLTKPQRIVNWIVYLIFRACTGLLERTPIEWNFRFGRLLGGLAGWFAPGYVRLARRNLKIAFGSEKSRAEIAKLAREHLRLLAANALAGVRLAAMPSDKILSRITVQGISHYEAAVREGRGVIALIGHQSCWEAIAQVSRLLSDRSTGAIYQRLGNPLIDAHIAHLRAKRGVELLERKTGVTRAVSILRNGGNVGLLIDQHAGTQGIWTPLFGRLASTTPLPRLLADHSAGVLMPVCMITTGIARWTFRIEEPLPDGLDAGATAAAVNRALENQVRASPADWFWVHDRWKTPKGDFLLRSAKRGVYVSAGSNLAQFRILLRSSNWLGDAVLSVPAVRAFKRGRPDSHVTVFTKAKLADFWRMIPEVDDVVVLPDRCSVRNAARAIRSRDPFDAAILFPNSLRSALEVWLAGVPVRVGYRGHFRAKLLTKIMPKWPRLEPPRSQVDVFLQLAKKCGADTLDPSLRDSLTFDLQSAEPSPPFGVICPGAEYGPAKRWHPERFASVAKHLSKRFGLQWIVVGTAKERALGDAVAKEIGGEPDVVNLAGRTTLTELAEQLRRCALLLTNDTGTMHLAGLLGTPMVAIFGSTEPALTSPLGARHRIVRRHVECSPCFLRTCPLDFRCMNEVTVDAVLAAAEALLNQRPDL